MNIYNFNLNQKLVTRKLNDSVFDTGVSYELSYVEDNGFDQYFIDASNYLLSVIFNYTYSFDKKVKNRFVSLKSEDLEYVLRQSKGGKLNNYNNVINKLIELNFIERSSGYQPKLKSYGYKIIITSNIKIEKGIQKIENNPFQKKAIKLIQKRENGLTKDQKDFLEYHRNLVNGKRVKLSIGYKDVLESLNDEARILQSALCDNINSGNFHISYDKQLARVYHNISNLKTILRGFLRIDGETLVELDFKNSQLVCLALLLENKYSHYLKDDMYKFIELAKSGKFYEFIMDGCPNIERKDIKKQILAYLYDRNRGGKYCKSISFFKNQFPALDSFIKNYKVGKYQSFSHILQSIEANIILNTQKVLIEMGIDAISIHDSIMVKSSQVNALKQVQEWVLNTYNIKTVIDNISNNSFAFAGRMEEKRRKGKKYDIYVLQLKLKNDNYNNKEIDNQKKEEILERINYNGYKIPDNLKNMMEMKKKYQNY